MRSWLPSVEVGVPTQGRPSRASGNKPQMWSQPGKRSLQAELTNVLEIKTRCTPTAGCFLTPNRRSFSSSTHFLSLPRGPLAVPPVPKTVPFPQSTFGPRGGQARPAAAPAGLPQPRPRPWLRLDFMEGAQGDNELPERILISPGPTRRSGPARLRRNHPNETPGPSELVYQLVGVGGAHPAPR